MLTSKNGKSILRCRWGKPRAASSLVRVSLSSRAIIDRLPEFCRRDFVDSAIVSASRTDKYHKLIERGR